MSLNNDTIQHPLPGNLQSRVENALNLVTSLEAEAERLRKLIANYKSEVNAAHAEKKYIEELTAKTKTDLETYQKQIQDANAALVHVHGNIQAANQELETAASIKAKTIQMVSDFNLDMEIRASAMKKSEDEIATMKSELLASKADHENRVERLKRAIE